MQQLDFPGHRLQYPGSSLQPVFNEASGRGAQGLHLGQNGTDTFILDTPDNGVAWALVLLWGLVLYQQVNVLPISTNLDNWLNAHLAFPHYPDPVAYLGLIGIFALVTAGLAGGIATLSARRDINFDRPGNFADRGSRFRAYFVPVAYGLIPVVGADSFARQLPTLFKNAPRVIPSIQHLFGSAGTNSSLYNSRILSVM